MDKKGETATTSAVPEKTKNAPTCIIVLGMAGSGKTTFVQRVTAALHSKNSPPYVFNLDPAVVSVPYPVNVDIRDTVDYKQLMQQYHLGPNGAIMTALNLFSTRFDQAMNLMAKREDQCPLVLLDTPGQIEVFTWSASGAVITETLASTYPTVIVYVLDSARCINPVTFMSNMLYACSILYRTKLPFIVVLNKADIVRPTFVIEWMTNFEAFHAALEGESSYMHDLSRSLSLALDQFYCTLKCVPVSAITGEGIDQFLKAVVDAGVEYEKEYRPEYERMRKEKLDKKSRHKSESICDSEQVHLGGTDVENAEDEKLRVFGDGEAEEDDSEADKESFRRFMKETLSIDKS